jgi:RNA polymerase sigma factor (sigma-70 family)
MPITPQETCWTLIRAAADGTGAAREEFTRRYLPAVRAFLMARWRHSLMQGEIDDAVQEVFIACFREGGALERADPTRGSGFHRFLLGVARNVALHLERTTARRVNRVSSGLDSEIAGDDEACSRAYDRAYARSLMREAAQRMAARALVADASGKEGGRSAERRVQLRKLRFEEGLAIRDIAKLWNTEADRLHQEYAKAGREFRSVLREVVGLAERCPPEELERECDRLLAMLRG